MRGDEFLDKMELTDPAYVQEADLLPAKTKRRWLLPVASAAVICLVGGWLSWPTPQENPPQLPMLTLPESVGEGMGFEGYMAFDISQLVNANPWREDAQLTTLPVYQNQLTAGAQPKWEEMEGFLWEIADALGLERDAVTLTNNAESLKEQETVKEELEGQGITLPASFSEPAQITGEAQGYKIQVDQTMTATISFEPAVALPEGYNFTHYASYEETCQVADYLRDHYSGLMGFSDLRPNICGGDYNIYRQQSHQVEFYQGADDLTQEMVNYSFLRATFSCDDEGKLFLARVFRTDLSQKIGDYPIIPLDEAKELLARGHYLTTVPYEMPGMRYVKKVELVYRNGTYEECYMPYYRFYVELPEQQEEDGLKTYGAYYVPAVEQTYLTNLPLWDESFNS